MTDDRSLERAARSWLEDGPTRAPDRPVDAALARIETTRQVRGLASPWRLPTVNPLVRLGAVGVAIAIAVGGSLYLLGRADGGAGAVPTASPTAMPTPTPVDGGSGLLAPGPVVVAQNIAFDRTALRVPRGEPFTITLRNADPAEIGHVIDIRSKAGALIQPQQEPIPGGTQRIYSYGALEPGTYTFICSIHPIEGMTGTLTVR
jgi:plastocyanin